MQHSRTEVPTRREALGSMAAQELEVPGINEVRELNCCKLCHLRPAFCKDLMPGPNQLLQNNEVAKEALRFPQQTVT